ncbi:glycine betaine transporter subunit; ATP-binding compoent of ABC superfamily [uncultured delta proteobacterium]|uniref:Glycine betaine transporter subunit ATP-binding compoent of ABC superfamily n=1 Tax=uncultured delta proteobacterium TaxID=34034 RepID=A0A212KCY0_9DELT|nr:glycine betaine transporter subunit; ATP-binding compoent of ABC superfamily [uncultured delta proteobacterium]
MPKIEIRGVTKVFGEHPSAALALLKKGRDKTEILRKTGCAVGVNNVSLDVREGEIVVLMGLSGSGKSTLLRCVNRLIEPSKGSVLVDGEDVMRLTLKALRELRQRKFGMVFQNFALFPHRTVLQNAEFGLNVMGVAGYRCREKAMEALEIVGLKGWEGKYPAQLSGGMQQRVGLARALALDPDILLMDEAFSALDPLIRREMQQELARLQEELRKTVIFVSHDLDEALAIGDRIVLMKDGAIIQIGSPEEILTAPADEYVAKFVADADLSRVLTASTVMKRSEAVAVLGVDGPRTALRKMRHAGIAYLFVVDRSQRLHGLISVEQVSELLASGGRDLESILHRDIKTVPLETSAAELIPLMAGLPYPLAVTDARGRLAGVIIRGTLLGALAEGGNGGSNGNGTGNGEAGGEKGPRL